MTFSFGFESSDIEGSPDEVEDYVMSELVSQQLSEVATPKHHDLLSLLKTLPSKISYATTDIPGFDGIPKAVPRRELFDIRAQLMAEDIPGQSTAVGLSIDDITPNVYEGGFKTWECSIDLANYVLALLHKGKCSEDGEYHFIEVGAGTAIPTLVIFQHFLTIPDSVHSAIHISLADYNQVVLETTTIPNLLLTWYFARSAACPPREGDLEINEDLLRQFLKDLEDRSIHISAISGAWCNAFCDLLVPFDGLRPQSHMQTWFLASETIYSPTTINIFTEVLMKTLKKAESAGSIAMALVAAKRVYFGVGGGVDEFLGVLRELDGSATVGWEWAGSGVSRLILDIVTTC